MLAEIILKLDLGIVKVVEIICNLIGWMGVLGAFCFFGWLFMKD